MTPRRLLPVRRSLRAAALLCAAALVASCSGEPASSPASTTPPSSSTSTTTTTTTSTTIPATTTTVPAPVYPLTGLPIDPSIEVFIRPALVVKIDNAPAANPQTGFNSADIVVEEIVNDNITRFAMVFHSQGSDPVGPIRSGRLQDVDLFECLNKPLFAWSGGNATVTKAVDDSELVNMGPSRVPVYYRESTRKAPHNLYSNTTKLWESALEGWGAPPQLFAYRRADDEPQGIVANGVRVEMGIYDAEWTWNPVTGLYERRQNGEVHEDAGTDSVITTHNVIVLVMDYVIGVSGSPDAQSVGSGEAWVFSGGRFVRGTWSRASQRDTFTLLDSAGKPIQLTPGRSFIELPRENSTTPF